MRCHRCHRRRTLDRAESSGENGREYQRERQSFEERWIWAAFKEAECYPRPAQRRVTELPTFRRLPSGRHYPRQVHENHDNHVARGDAQEKPRTSRERGTNADCRDASQSEHSTQNIATGPCGCVVKDDLQMQAHDRTEHHRQQEPWGHEMRLGIAKQRHAAAFKRIPEWKLMVAMENPIRRPLRSRVLIPVVKSTCSGEMGQQRKAEDQCKRRARDGDCNSLAPGETPPLE